MTTASSTFSSEYGKVLRGRFSEAAFSPTPDFTLDSILALDFTLAFLLALELATSHRDFPLTLDNLINRKQSTYRVFDIVRALDEVRTLYRARTLNNNLDFVRIRARARAIGLNDSLILALYNVYSVYSQTGAHDFDHTSPFDCTLDLDRCFTPNNLFALRGLCCILICLEILARNKHSNFKRISFKRFLLETTKTAPYRNIEQKQNPALNLYAFFFLIEERRKGNLPAWEGIRIVRERLE